MKSSIEAEIAIVCGKDAFMKKNIERMAKRYPNKTIHVYGFIDFMFELMNISDIIVSKGGPATVLEALMLEKPLIVSQYVFGQEKGNVDFVRRERLDRERLPADVGRLLGCRDRHRDQGHEEGRDEWSQHESTLHERRDDVRVTDDGPPTLGPAREVHSLAQPGPAG